MVIHATNTKRCKVTNKTFSLEKDVRIPHLLLLMSRDIDDVNNVCSIRFNKIKSFEKVFLDQ